MFCILYGSKQRDFIGHITKIDVIWEALDRLNYLLLHAYQQSVTDLSVPTSCAKPKFGKPLT